MTISVPPGRTMRPTWVMACRRGGSGSTWSVCTSTTSSKPCRHPGGGASRAATTSRASEPGKRRRAAWIALLATSKATVSNPRAATYSASSPRPQPTTSARRPRPRSPRCRAHSASSRLGAPPHGTSASPAPASAYRRSNQPTGSPRAREPAARRRAYSYGSGLFIRLGAPPSLLPGSRDCGRTAGLPGDPAAASSPEANVSAPPVATAALRPMAWATSPAMTAPGPGGGGGGARPGGPHAGPARAPPGGGAGPAGPVSRGELLRRARAGEVLVLDVRPAAEYSAGPTPGAVSVPLGDLPARLGALPASTEIVAYCRGAYCVLARDAVRQLRASGLAARHLAEGMLEWRLDGLPVDAA